MDITALVISFVSPFIPYLLKAGKPVAEEAGKKLGEKIGEDSWAKVKQIWTKLLPKLSEKPLAKGAVDAIELDPKDKEAKEVLLKQIEKLLQSDKFLAQELQGILVENQETIADAKVITNIDISSQGDDNIIVGNSSGDINIAKSK